MSDEAAWIPVVPESEATGELEALYARVADPETGAVDNIMRVHSLLPAGLAAHFELYVHAMKGSPSLRKVDREIIALVVSGLNACEY